MTNEEAAQQLRSMIDYDREFCAADEQAVAMAIAALQGEREWRVRNYKVDDAPNILYVPSLESAKGFIASSIDTYDNGARIESRVVGKWERWEDKNVPK